MKNKLLIGAAAGLVINRTIQKSTYDYWINQGNKARDKREQAYNSALGEGKTQDEAITLANKENPTWMKLGSNRINGMGTALIGSFAYLIDKEVGAGIAAAGVAKVFFPHKVMDLDFEQK